MAWVASVPGFLCKEGKSLPLTEGLPQPLAQRPGDARSSASICLQCFRSSPRSLNPSGAGLPANCSVLRCVTPPWAPSPLSQRPRSRGCAGGRWGTKPVAGARPDPRPLPAESAAGSPPLPACGDLQAASAALPGHKHTQEGVSRQRRSRAGRAPPRRDSQLRAQPRHSPRLPASQLREPNVCREQVFCPLDSLPRGGSPCHGDAVPRCHGSCRRAGRAHPGG